MLDVAQRAVVLGRFHFEDVTHEFVDVDRVELATRVLLLEVRTVRDEDRVHVGQVVVEAVIAA